ncbi:MAG: MMPL family transporter [Chloroflexota bacterium]|nr:MMPL family transporter [Dehalococcoidia bacterium]MDW8253287.1 MMPL family transporter [Chloroflexota bacterium]
MFSAIGRRAVQFRWLIILLWAAAFAISLPFLPQVAKTLRPGGFASDDLESQRALALLGERLGLDGVAVQVIMTSERLDARTPEFVAQSEAALATLRQWPLVKEVKSFTAAPEQIASDGKAAYVTVILDRRAEQLPNLPAEIEQRLTAQPDLRLALGGGPIFYEDIQRVSENDLRRAELLAIPFAAAALLFVFRSVVAALLPALVGGVAAAIALALIAGIAQVTPLSIFVLNVATLLGLGLGVDYSLFIVSRFREELERAPSVAEATVATVATAGRAVFFSGLTVAIGLAALIAFRFNILRSVGIGGVVVVLLAVAAALTLLPAVLSILGRRVNALPLPWALRPREEGFWRRLATNVMRRPGIVLIPTMIVLLSLGAPFLQIKLGAPDASILPAGTPSREAFELLDRRFPATETTPILLAVQARNGALFDPANLAALDQYVRRIQAHPAVSRVESIVSLDPRFTLDHYLLMYANPDRISDAFVQAAVRGLVSGDTTVVRVISRYGMTDPRSYELVGALRNSRPLEFTVLVTGGSAGVVDYVNTLYRDFPIAIAAIMAVTYLVLLVLFRSLLLPLKAIVMNLLSIVASYGALVWVFQHGNLSSVLGFTPLGYIEASIPVIMFCALFGLSMDYEVFLLSRVQEVYQQTGDNLRAVAEGLERSGRIVTSAALIVVAVSIAFLSADMILVKALGLGIAIAVTVDVTLVRALVVPSTMRLLGAWNWWLPPSLDRLLPRVEHERTSFAEAAR